jgi:hypothetical protein
MTPADAARVGMVRLYYRPAEVAAITGESLRTVWRRIREGNYRSERRGRCRLVLAADVEGREAQVATPAPRRHVSREARTLARELGL